MEQETVIGNISSLQVDDEVALSSTNSPFATTFYFEDFYDEKACKNFIKATERLIRQSKEYSSYIELVRSNLHELNRDNLLSNITSADAKMEFHHYPFSLYDVVEIVMSKMVIDGVKFTSFSLAKQVLDLHYKHEIGLVPLTKTTHELAHSGSIFISKDQVFGDYKKFMEEYKDGISQELLQTVYEMEILSSRGTPSDFKGLL